VRHEDAIDEHHEELRLEDFEDWEDPEVQLKFLEVWDETGQPRQCPGYTYFLQSKYNRSREAKRQFAMGHARGGQNGVSSRNGKNRTLSLAEHS
jgi:hypothetical protein